MFKGVLDEGDEYQRRNLTVWSFLGKADMDTYLISITQLHQRNIVTDKVKLPRQRHNLLITLVEHKTHHLRQFQDRILRLLRVYVDKGMDVVECIHEEMRIDLIAQVLQLLLQVLLLQFGQSLTVVATAEIALDTQVGTKHQDKQDDGHDVSLANEGRRSVATMHLGTRLTKRLMTAAVLSCALIGALGAVAEDGYIESYGTGSICLGHFAGPNTKIEVDMEMKELVNGTRLFGGYGNHSSSLSFFLYFGTISSTDTRIRYSWDTSDIDGKRMAWNMDVASVGERRTISFDAPTRTYTSIPHGESAGYSHTFSKAVLNKTSSYPLAVFGSSTDRAYGASTNDFTVKAWPVRMKCYGVKIYESGALVKNFVPCVKGGIAGLKETINNRFMSSVNVKAVGYGGDILEEKDDPFVATFSNTNSLYLANTRLAGKSIYFSTGYYMKPTSKLELDYALLTPDWAPGKLHGSMLNLIAGGSSSKKMYVDVYGSAATRGNFYISLNGSDSAPDIRVDTACDVRRTVTITSNSYAFVTAGYTNVSWTTTGGIKEVQNYWGIKLACNQSYDGGFTPMKIYGLKIYESGALIKDFRPFVTNGVAGLIDRLDTSKKLFPITYCSNNKTNVVAEAGGDLEREGYTAASESEAYLVFDGVSGHNINTDYVITPNSCIEADFALWKAGGVRQELIRLRTLCRHHSIHCAGRKLQGYRQWP